jgi:hypothetical protein
MALAITLGHARAYNVVYLTAASEEFRHNHPRFLATTPARFT